MKVKIRNKIYDSKDEPVMIILESQDKENVKNMLPECTKLCSFPIHISSEDINKFMTDGC